MIVFGLIRGEWDKASSAGATRHRELANRLLSDSVSSIGQVQAIFGGGSFYCSVLRCRWDANLQTAYLSVYNAVEKIVLKNEILDLERGMAANCLTSHA